MFDWLLLTVLQTDLEAASLSQNIPIEHVLEEVKEAPKLKDNKLAPVIKNEESLAIFAQDLESGKVLFSKNEFRSQNMASLTKIMTYLIIRDNHDLDDVVTIPEAALQVDGVKISLYAYEKLTVGTLLEAILIPSANDAATALAIWDSGSEAAFAQKMNDKAKEMGLHSAVFYNASGLDLWSKPKPCPVGLKGCMTKPSVLIGNKISASDAAIMTSEALKDRLFRSIVQKGHFTGYSVDGKFEHDKPTTNQLYGSFINTRGIKTGYTPLAKECFINLSVLDGQEILTVVLGSSDRFGETKRLVDWIDDAYVWQ